MPLTTLAFAGSFLPVHVVFGPDDPAVGVFYLRHVWRSMKFNHSHSNAFFFHS